MRPKWTIPALLLTILAVGATAAFAGMTMLGDPWADFLVVAALTEAGLLAWTALDKGLSRRQRGWLFGLLVAAPIVGLAFTDVSPLGAFREFFRKQPEPASYEPPPPKEFNYEYPKSDVVPDLTKTSPHDWRGFRGKYGLGRAASPVKLATDWKKNPPKLLWKHPIGGGGGSSVAIVGDFLLSNEQRGKWEVLACYELRTGKQCWEHREDQYFFETFCAAGPRTAPVVVDGNVVTYGGLGRLLKVDGRTGEPLWHVDLLKVHQTNGPSFGITASPLVVDGMVIAGVGATTASLVAHDLETGKLRWKAPGKPASYSSPTEMTLSGFRQIVWFNMEGLYGYDPADGRELWSQPFSYGNRNNVAQPLAFSSTGKGEPDSVMISAGDGAGCAAFAIEKNGGEWKPRKLWENQNLRLKYSSAIQFGDMAVGLDEHILAAIDLKTGKRRWKHGGDRFGYGQIVSSGEQLLVQAEDGKVIIGDVTDKDYIERGKFETVVSKTWNTPALAGDILAVRGVDVMAVYQLPTAEK